MDSGLNHFDNKGNSAMVDVTDKNITERTAIAKGTIRVNKRVFKAIVEGTAAKGDVLAVSRVARIMGAKHTPELITMCHPIMLTKSALDFELHEDTFSVDSYCTVKLSGKTGVEMEAITGVSVALLTIYDMCKALDKSMEITDIHLVKKTGGKSGTYTGRL